MRKLALVALLVGCTPSGATPPPPREPTHPFRVRFDDDGVTCYVWRSNANNAAAISCLRDEPRPAPLGSESAGKE